MFSHLGAQSPARQEIDHLSKKMIVTTEPDSIPPDSTDIRSLTSLELAQK
jgi:hypothetical protein